MDLQSWDRRAERQATPSFFSSLLERQAHFPYKQPVFVSIGGADGEELDYLLRNSTSTHGILVEGFPPLAEAARRRVSSLPEGKTVEVIEGDAKEKVATAVRRAHSLVKDGCGDCAVVTCHAVIHELSDRGTADFDPIAFFSSIFEDEGIPTFFTYREPAVPQNWPDEILISADCSPQTLLTLANAIMQRHPQFRTLRPTPHVAGQALRANRTLAMELLSKLFYVADLRHEIEERATSVDHSRMINCLSMAIGDSAVTEGRAYFETSSAATASFRNLSIKQNIRLFGIRSDSSRSPLPIPESHTRLVAYRVPPTPSIASSPAASVQSAVEGAIDHSLELTRRAADAGDMDLVRSLSISYGRQWIEGRFRLPAVELLAAIGSRAPHDSVEKLWCTYLDSLAQLFARDRPDESNPFTDSLIEAARGHGLDLLFKAERLEFTRKAGDDAAAVNLANSLAGDLRAAPCRETPLSRYALGTSHILLANFLRWGGRYQLALQEIFAAESLLSPGIPSHDTELAHCYYARAVCHAMQGLGAVAPHPKGSEQEFVAGLIQLSYSHVAWVLDQAPKAGFYATAAESTFRNVDTRSYERRAATLRTLISEWEMRDNPGSSLSRSSSPLEANIRNALTVISGEGGDEVSFRGWFPTLRPSAAAGLLQFRRFEKLARRLELASPKVLELDEGGSFRWRPEREYDSLQRVEESLRLALGVPKGLRVPLIAD